MYSYWCIRQSIHITRPRGSLEVIKRVKSCRCLFPFCIWKKVGTVGLHCIWYSSKMATRNASFLIQMKWQYYDLPILVISNAEYELVKNLAILRCSFSTLVWCAFECFLNAHLRGNSTFLWMLARNLLMLTQRKSSKLVAQPRFKWQCIRRHCAERSICMHEQFDGLAHTNEITILKFEKSAVLESVWSSKANSPNSAVSDKRTLTHSWV